MKHIIVVGSGIIISVSSYEEMYMMFFKLLGTYDLQVDGDFYARSVYPNCHGYTRGYFKKKYFSEV